MQPKFVLDTSAFTNLGGKKATQNKKIRELIDLICTARAGCHTTPLAWNELRGMLENKKIAQKEIHRLHAHLIEKSPSRMELLIPAEFLYQYVGEVRDRFNQGLREAEKAVLSVGGNRPDPLVIKDLRGRFKTKIRQGMLDSKEDLELLLLAKELKAGIVTKDAGVKDWARRWGIRVIDSYAFPRLIKEYAR